MSINVMTLGKEGVLRDPDLKIDYLMCCFFFSKYSQSTLFRGRVSSLMKLIQMYGNHPVSIQQELEASLQSFLAKWFTTASVSVNIDPDVDPGISLRINAIVSDEDSIDTDPRSVGYSLMTKDSMLKSIVNITNGKTIYQS